MADDIRRLRHKAEEIDDTIDMLMEVYTREEIESRFTGIMQKISEIEEKITALEKEEWQWKKL